MDTPEPITLHDRRKWNMWKKKKLPIFKQSKNAQCEADDPLLTMPNEKFQKLERQVEEFLTEFICKAERAKAPTYMTFPLRFLYEELHMQIMVAREKRPLREVKEKSRRARGEWLASLDKVLQSFYYEKTW